MSDLAQALMIAIRVHAGQTDKQGQPYLFHVLRVMEAVESQDERIVAVLHDVIEDSELTVEEVVAAVEQQGFRLRFEQALRLLTRRETDTYADYIGYIAAAPEAGGHIARRVKLADLRDNLGRIPPRPVEPDPSIETILADKTEEAWDEEWATLKDRYERALATLEGTASESVPASGAKPSKEKAPES